MEKKVKLLVKLLAVFGVAAASPKMEKKVKS
jgi:hypothetical protein